MLKFAAALAVALAAIAGARERVPDGLRAACCREDRRR